MIPFLRIGTRGSELALWQAGRVAARLKAHRIESEIVVIETEGDQKSELPFISVDDATYPKIAPAPGFGAGVFVKAIEDALLAGKIDIAVHSAKDMPTALAPGTELGAIPERADPRDALVTREGLALAELPRGARVATSSLRRAAQILALRPDLKIVPIRGNVPTRLRKVLDGGEADALIAAMAGLIRLDAAGAIRLRNASARDRGAQGHNVQEHDWRGRAHDSAEAGVKKKSDNGIREVCAWPMDILAMTPQMGQGALAMQVRAGEMREMLNVMRHAVHDAAVRAERAFITALGGGCATPAGACAAFGADGAWSIMGFIGSPDGAKILRRTVEGLRGDTALIDAAGTLAAAMLQEAGPALKESAGLTAPAV